MLIVFVSFSTMHPAHAATSSTGIVIPLYTYPTDGTWDQIIQVKKAHPSVPIIAVINPNNGPSTSLDSNYVTGIQKLQAAGVMVLGYVHTGFGYGGLRSPTVLETEISNYKTWYNPNGIFFDEMANIAGDENYYTVLSTYAKSLGFTYTMGNPGTETLPSYIGTVDNIVIYESGSLPAISDLTSWHTQYSKSNFSYIALGSSLDTAFETQSSQYVSYIYITDLSGGNPYNALPSYFGNEVAMLDTGSAPTVPTAPSLTSAAASSSQINLSWSAPSSNGGSAITGYKIDRSTDGGSTWASIVSSTGSTSTTYSNTGLVSGTTYTYRVSAINSVGTSSSSNTVSATTSSSIGSTAPQPPTSLTTTAVSSSQINLSWSTPSNNGGSAITGYKIDRSTDGGVTWSTLVANSGSTSTTSSDTGLSSSMIYTYHVSAINPIGTSAPSNIVSATTSIVATTVSITVNSVNLSGTPITGMWTELHSSNGTILATGYTPITFKVNSGVQYTVVATNYQTTIFNHWNNGTTTSSKTITPTTSTTLTAYYSTTVSVTVKSVDLNGNPITGMWTELHDSSGKLLKTGYTPITFKVNPGVQYTVVAANYQTTIFNHWNDGTTTSSKTITPTKSAILTAYYSIG